MGGLLQMSALLILCTATAASLTPGTVNLDLVFPLNDTYAPPTGQLPIVFALSSQPFQPALTSTLQLILNYTLLDAYNRSNIVDSGHFDLVKLSSGSDKNPFFFFSYTDALAGREGQVMIQGDVSLKAGIPSNSDPTKKYVDDLGIFKQAHFTLKNGAQVPSVPTAADNRTSCLPHASWSVTLDISDYMQDNGSMYAVMGPDFPIDAFGPRKCALVVDDSTASSISAGMSTAPTGTPTSSPTASPTPSPAGSGGSLSGMKSPGRGILTVAWSIVSCGVSVLIFG